jgi:hypothetical protein
MNYSQQERSIRRQENAIVGGFLAVAAGLLGAGAISHISNTPDTPSTTYEAVGPSCKAPLQGKIVLPEGCTLKPAAP